MPIVRRGNNIRYRDNQRTYRVLSGNQIRPWIIIRGMFAVTNNRNYWRREQLKGKLEYPFLTQKSCNKEKA
jgi:hypothetical protein